MSYDTDALQANILKFTNIVLITPQWKKQAWGKG